MSFGAIMNDFSTVAAYLGLALLSSASLAEFKGNGIKRILVPTDFSEYSDIALKLAIDLAKQQKATICLLHVLRFRDSSEELHMMQRQIARFPEAKNIEIAPKIKKGKIYEEILNAEAEEKADLIIMSRHREFDSLMSLFRGITVKVRKHARSSVLVVGA